MTPGWPPWGTVTLPSVLRRRVRKRDAGTAPGRRPFGWRRWWGGMVYAYAALACAVWFALQSLTDRALPATLIAFGPRWLTALPLVPLMAIVVARVPIRQMAPLVGSLGLTAAVLMFGVLDF